ncbi:MAG TPA: hypothetical protein VEQ85_04460, partial [Lacipirellulaceae bacterium]|nr:hypothetical protein [Lacipirellulaceae bacterium]
MNQSFNRKIVYLVALAALLWPMAWLGSPSTVSDPEGGKLAQLRSEARLGQADLGAIDPASETIRMATLGLRGMAVTMLWNKANQYKKVEDWDAFQATLDQLSRLQPYFVKVWQYQAWNLTYNVSVELDDVRDRFYYVKRGIFYLKDGIQYLRDNPTLLDDLGWFTGNKVGRADEHELYRRMFKADDELHAADTQSQARDNWLVSRQWYELAISAVDDRGQPLGTKNPVTFFDSPARSQMSYAEAIEEEGVQNSLWRSAWELGGELWHDYATREMRATQGFMVRLADQEKYEADMRRYADELDALRPGMSDVLRREAEAGLSDKQKELLAAPPANPTPEEATLSQQATEALDITPAEVAARIAAEDPDKASAARKLANQILAANERARSISTDRDVANYAYWESRCKIEQTDAALNARRLAHEGRRAFQDEGDLDKAREKYEACFVQWAEALKAVPEIGIDSTFGGDLMEFVDDYHKVLQQLDLSLSDKGVA